MKTNMTFIYTAGFFIFYFFVTIYSKNKYPPLQRIIYTIVYYIFFIIYVNFDLIYTFIIGILIFIIYLLETIKLFYSTNKNPDENYWITLDYPIKIRKYKFDKSQLNTITKIESAMKLIIIITIFMGLYKYLKIN